MLSLVPMTYQIRRSKLYIKDTWINDPVNPSELLKLIPFPEKIRLTLDLLKQKENVQGARNFEAYVVDKFGDYMFDTFFRPYTEKLFGIKSADISPVWAENKVRLINPFRGKRQNTRNTFSYFHYPIEGGYGAIIDTLYQQVESHVLLNCPVTGIVTDEKRICGIEYQQDGKKEFYPCDTVISTLPLSITARFLGTSLDVSYRKVASVYLWIDKPQVMDYHWVYFTPDDIAMNRMVEFKNLNPGNYPSDTSVLCAEVTQQHEDVEEKVIQDLVRTGLIERTDILDTKVISEMFGYPVYRVGTEAKVARVKAVVDAYHGIYLVGRAAEFIHREVDDIFARAKTVADLVSQQKITTPVKALSEMEKRKICITVLNFNNFEDTAECLKSLEMLADDLHEIIVVDNGSSDGSPEKLRQAFPDVEMLALPENVGVPAGFNKGVQYALRKGFEYVFILNNDTVVAPDMLSELLKVTEQHQDSGILMPSVLYYPPEDRPVTREDVWADGGYFRKFPPGIVHKDNRGHIDFDQPRLVEYVPTCGLLIHRKAFEKVGLFDPGYFFFFEDWDFSERVRKAGLEIWSVPSAKMWHKVSRTTRADSELYWRTMGESTIRFFRRHYSPFSSLIQISYRVLRDLVLTGHLKYWKPFMTGVRKGLAGQLGDYPDIANFMSSADASSSGGTDEI
jgi:GT2 family glycosyltransferase/protoporphyrinogen oxidase